MGRGGDGAPRFAYAPYRPGEAGDEVFLFLFFQKKKRLLASLEQRRIAITVEPIVVGDGVGVGVVHAGVAGEGAGEHVEGGAGEVEIGEEDVGAAEIMAGEDEEGGFGVEGVDDTVFVGGGFEEA